MACLVSRVWALVAGGIGFFSLSRLFLPLRLFLGVFAMWGKTATVKMTLDEEVQGMSVQVRVPTPLRRFTGGAEEVNANGATVAALVNNLEKNYPGIKERICDEEGRVRRFVNIFVNGDDIRFLSNLDTAVKDGDEISIVPAIAGG